MPEQDVVSDFSNKASGVASQAKATLADATSSVIGARYLHKLKDSADYVRIHDSKEMMFDIESFVKSHPGQSLIAAGIIGFLAGRAFSNND